jgi:hypothetical protein
MELRLSCGRGGRGVTGVSHSDPWTKAGDWANRERLSREKAGEAYTWRARKQERLRALFVTKIIVVYLKDSNTTKTLPPAH